MIPRHLSRHGASAVEFALTLPILLLVVMGIVELSLLMHRSYTVTRVARDSCRVGSGVLEGVEPTGDLIETSAEEHATFALEAADIDCGAGCDVEATWYEADGWMMLWVDVDVPYDPFTGMLPMLPDTTHGGFVMLTQQQIFE